MIKINSKPESFTSLTCLRVKPHKNETLYSWLARKLYQERLLSKEKEE